MYCDYAATTPLSNEMKKYLTGLLDDFGNPSSQYKYGDKTRQIVESARQSVRRFINAPEDSRVIFTPSGSGSNTLGTSGFFSSSHNKDFSPVFSPLLHKSLNEFMKSQWGKLAYVIDVNEFGNINLLSFKQDLRFMLHLQERLPLVIVEYANSEIGTIQPIKEIAEITHQNRGRIYVDCTGAISSVPIDVQNLDVDMIGFSAHKLGALKGCGVLWAKNSIHLNPLVYGAQEDGFVGGTENVLGIGSLGYAIDHCEYKNFDAEMRKAICGKIAECGWKLAGDESSRLPNSFYFCVPGKNAEEIVIRLDSYHDIQASTGSACSSGNKKPSSALQVIGVPEEDLFSYIRLSFHGDESLEKVFNVLATIKEVADEEM